MEIRDDIEVGVATHTGPVRSSNEDDYLVYEPGDAAALEDRGRLYVIADGMGGVAGGAEASRAAVRALAAAFVDGGEGPMRERLARGFEAAAREVFRVSRSSVQLADMGTTLTALALHGTSAVIAHVGDTRCALLRDGDLSQLTEDHAVEEPRHLLTRCLGAGRESEDVDLIELAVEPGDVFALITDGVWGTVDDAVIAQVLRTQRPAAAAQRLVELAFATGGTDNATAVVVAVAAAEPGRFQKVELPVEEPIVPLQAPELALQRPRWPWFVLVAAVAVSVLAAVRLLLGAQSPW